MSTSYLDVYIHSVIRIRKRPSGDYTNSGNSLGRITDNHAS